MNDQIILLAAPLSGLAVGTLLTWLILRSHIATAVEQGKSEALIELATIKEHVRSLEQECQNSKTSYDALMMQANEWRDALDGTREENSRLTERAARIPELESQIHGLQEKQKLSQQEILRLTASDAEKGQSLHSTTTRLAEVEQAHANAEHTLAELGEQSSQLRESSSRLNAELMAERENLTAVRNDLQIEKNQREQAQAEASRLKTQLAESNIQLDAERSQGDEKLALLLEAKEALSNQFKSLANDIMEEKSKRFTEQNQTNIGQLLNPLKERLTEFKAKVEEIHTKDTEQQATLKAELAQLKDLNRQMTEEAHGLATALKGHTKKQGNWGELVLGNVLDRCGLREGKDFKREVSFNTEEGRKRPDVIIYLPQSKHLVIDAKVSLNAYTRYVNAEDDLERQKALQEHVSAIADRIQELSSRVYFELPGINSPEMIFMFIPIESAFVEALRADESLFQKAIEQNVLVATPTTLLTSLNIVRQLWRFEEQNAHTAELAERAGKVYKKLVSFLGSMEALGKQLDKAKESFGTAMGQLYIGKGNLIGQAKQFEKLGVSVQIPLPENLVAKAALELEHLPEFIEGAELEANEA